MTTPLKLLIVAGSARRASLNARLARAAAALARDLGLVPVELDARELLMPVYDGDLEAEQGVPPAALQLQQALLDSDGLLVVTPEYNGFPTPLLINAFDWLSRITAAPPRPAGLAGINGLPVALLSASPGPLGGLRSMNLLRQYLQGTLQMIVVPPQFALSRAHEAFDEQGALRDPKAVQSVTGTLRAWARLAGALKAAPTAG